MCWITNADSTPRVMMEPGGDGVMAQIGLRWTISDMTRALAEG